MYAIIASGGKQYRVSAGETIKLEKLAVEQGGDIQFDQVLMVSDGNNIKVGAPYVSGGIVKASVVEHGRHDKIRIIKHRRRKHHMKQMGHRQYYTAIKIVEIIQG